MRKSARHPSVLCAARIALLALAPLVLTGCTGEITGESSHDDSEGATESNEGTLQLTLVSNAARTASTPEHYLERDDGTWLRLHFAPQALHALADHRTGAHDHAELPVGSRLRVRGVATGGDGLFVRAFDLVGQPAEEGPIQQPLIAASGKRVAVILANFANDQSQPLTTDGARAAVFTDRQSTNAYFKEISFGVRTLGGKVRPDGDVFGWYTLSIANTGCDYVGWGNAARAAAQAAGVDLSGYDHVVHYFPRVTACGWSGVGQVPGRYTWINGSSPQTIAHELGHNFGLHHGSALSCTDGSGARVTVSATCSSSEYGDPFDVMGRGYRHMNAYHKGRLGWFEPENTFTVAADGTFTIVPIGQKAAGIQSLRVAIDATSFYYLEFRQPFGFDAFSSTASVVNGVLIHRAPHYTTMQRPQLLDTTPATTSFTDAALTTGRTFRDPSIGLAITVKSVSAAGAVVSVDVR